MKTECTRPNGKRKYVLEHTFHSEPFHVGVFQIIMKLIKFKLVCEVEGRSRLCHTATNQQDVTNNNQTSTKQIFNNNNKQFYHSNSANLIEIIKSILDLTICI